jgi:hypothetical protein
LATESGPSAPARRGAAQGAGGAAHGSALLRVAALEKKPQSYNGSSFSNSLPLDDF